MITIIRCMTLPTGIYDLIVDFLPVPREWAYSLELYRKRSLSLPHPGPQQCVSDICNSMDEMLADANIFRGTNQKMLICKLNNNRQVSHIYIYRYNKF
jgi:hypothetical protein